MCKFFSFCTDSVNHPAEYYFFDWDYRKANLDDDGVDSHSHICAHFKLNEDKCNKYEYSPVTGEFVVDQINSKRDDQEAAENWVKRLDFKTIVEPLIIKPIVKPFELPKVEQVTDEQIDWLKSWASVRVSVWNSVRASVRASVGNSVWNSVGASVWASVGDLVGSSVRNLVGASVWASVRASAWDSVWNSVEALVGAYVSSFFAINYKYNFSSVANLWNAGLVPSFDGETWRLHSGKSADIVCEWTPEVQE